MSDQIIVYLPSTLVVKEDQPNTVIQQLPGQVLNLERTMQTIEVVTPLPGNTGAVGPTGPPGPSLVFTQMAKWSDF